MAKGASLNHFEDLEKQFSIILSVVAECINNSASSGAAYNCQSAITKWLLV